MSSTVPKIIQLTLLASALMPCPYAQSPAQEPLSFEVASVRPAKGCTSCGTRITPGAQGYRAQGVTLRALVTVAYRIDPRQLSGGPAWTAADKYDIEARADRPRTADEIHLMLKHLLEDRFRLQVRSESREEPVWNLIVAKSGLKMPVHDPNDKDYQPIHGQAKKNADGSTCPGLAADNVSMDSFVRVLTRVMGRPVIDRTGLTGRYDLQVAFRGEGSRSGGDVSSSPNPNCSDAFEALPQQLGLRLEAAKGPVDYITIEHVERPSEN